MKIKTCQSCNKKMTVETDYCFFCGSNSLKSKTSKSTILIALILLTGTCFIGYTIFQTVADKASKTGVAAGKKISSLANSVQSTAKVIASSPNQAVEAIETVEQAFVADSESELQLSENYDEGEEQFSDNSYDVEENEASAKRKERRAYWQKIYKDKYTAPLAGGTVSLKLKNGKVVTGLFMGIVGSTIRLEIDNEIKAFSKSKLSKRSRCQLFSKDYVEYFVDKRLKDENLI